eukprot:9494787-Pyramimonas_sp.AAC.1
MRSTSQFLGAILEPSWGPPLILPSLFSLPSWGHLAAILERPCSGDRIVVADASVGCDGNVLWCFDLGAVDVNGDDDYD